MEPKVIKEGGHNYGAHQRPGPVTFGTVVLKRGMTASRDLWKWFRWVNGDARYAFRMNVTITLMRPIDRGEGVEPAITFGLKHALPVKFKAADLNARGTEVGIEELHLAHEGLSIS
jgi:phage tail-like protein